MTYKGECFCGAVHIEVSGEPEGMGYCHCRSCRSWSGGPVNAFTLWKPGAVRVTAGAEQCRHVPEDTIEPAAILQEVRRPSDEQSPADRPGRCVRSNDTDVEVPARRPHQLRRDGAADARWTAEAEGFPCRVRRIGRAGAGVAPVTGAGPGVALLLARKTAVSAVSLALKNEGRMQHATMAARTRRTSSVIGSGFVADSGGYARGELVRACRARAAGCRADSAPAACGARRGL